MFEFCNIEINILGKVRSLYLALFHVYVCKHVHDYIWFFFLVCAPKGLFGECRAVTGTYLNYSYSEANTQTCIKAPKWVSVFVGSSLRARSQIRHQLLRMERNLVKAFSISWKGVMGWEKIYSHMEIKFLVLQWKVSKVYLRDKSLESINLLLQVRLPFPKASFCITNTKKYLCTFIVLHVCRTSV